MAKYVNVEILKVLAEQLCEARDLARLEFYNSGNEDDYYLGEAEGVEYSVDLIEAVIKEHAVNGRLKWND